VNQQRAAEIQVVLEGVSLPASRAELVQYASLEDAELAAELERIPDREFSTIDEVGEELARTQPRPPAEVPLPKPESGVVPGGDEYLNPHPESGGVRVDAPPDLPASEQIAAASATIKRQKAEQER
jgi:hypothetical protein